MTPEREQEIRDDPDHADWEAVGELLTVIDELRTRSKTIYIGVSKWCDSCGGDMRVMAKTEPLDDEAKQEVERGTGGCAVTQYFECESDDDVAIIVNMNPGMGY